MDDLNRREGYLEGLLAGIDEIRDPQTAQLFHAVADLLSELTQRVRSHDVLLSDLNDYVESIDDDLAALEGEDDYRFDSNGESTGPADIVPFNRASVSEPVDFMEDDDEETESYAGRVCPDCGAIFLVSANDDPFATYRCPSCKKCVHPLMLTPETACPVRPEA